MAIRLDDDGTLDTVCFCDTCGWTYRYNYEPTPSDDNGEDSSGYDDFVSWALDDAVEIHSEIAPACFEDRGPCAPTAKEG